MSPYDINDKVALLKALKALKPGDFIKVKGNGGPMTMGVPSLKDDIIVQPLDNPQQSREGDSWLD